MFNLNELPLPAQRKVFTDVDKTILDTDGRPTDNAIVPALRAMQHEGWTVGLNSNRYFKGNLATIAQQFGIEGPLIAENGGHITYPDGSEDYDHGIQEMIGATREQIAHDLSRRGFRIVMRSQFPGVTENSSVPELVNPGDKVLLVDDPRRVTDCMHVRRADSTCGLRVDEELAETMKDIADYYPDGVTIDTRGNKAYTLVLPTTKRDGIARDLKREAMRTGMPYPDGSKLVGMVGDTQADNVGPIAVVYAVPNARRALKREADYVATRSVAQIFKGMALH